jgi:hypothetical protein
MSDSKQEAECSESSGANVESQSAAESAGSTPNIHQSTGNSLKTNRFEFDRWDPGMPPSDDTFDDEWKQFVEACELNGDPSVYDVQRAGLAFSRVFDSSYNSEKKFSAELFSVLKLALGDTWEEVKEGKAIALKLKNQQFGFAENLRRQALGFPDSYGISKNSECVHCVLVFQKTSEGNDGTKTAAYKHKDLTSVVELKMSDTSCGEIKPKTYVGRKGRVADEPDLTKKSDYGPLAQTILYGFDVFHCLARRGIRVVKIPLTIVAALKKEKEKKAEKDVNNKRRRKTNPAATGAVRLWCVDACLNIYCKI